MDGLIAARNSSRWTFGPFLRNAGDPDADVLEGSRDQTGISHAKIGSGLRQS
jgi:hypothetical protein